MIKILLNYKNTGITAPRHNDLNTKYFVFCAYFMCYNITGNFYLISVIWMYLSFTRAIKGIFCRRERIKLNHGKATKRL